MKRVNGSVSVILALSIIMILSFCLVLVESAREKTLLLKADIVWSACANSILAEYHKTLWEEYDVFYVDASYQTDVLGYGLLENRFRYYAEENLKYDKSGWLALSYDGGRVLETVLATDNLGNDFYQKAIEATDVSQLGMLAEEVSSWIETIETHIDLGKDLEVTQADITNQINEARKEEVEIENPVDGIESGGTLLKMIIGDDFDFSEKTTDLSKLATHRMLEKGSASDPGSENTILDKMMFCKYVQEHFGCYTNPSEDAPLSYEIEYILAGKASDIGNMESVVGRLLLIREADNYLTLLQDEAKKLEAHAIATASASIAPWLEPVVYHGLLIYWAYEMSVEDLRALFSGKSVPLSKTLFGETDMAFSLSYEDYIWLLLLIEQKEKLTMRSIDSIERNIQQEQEHFRMDVCVSMAEIEGTFRDVYNKQYTITKTLQYY